MIINPFLNVSYSFSADKTQFGSIMYSSASNYYLFISNFISINQSKKTI